MAAPEAPETVLPTVSPVPVAVSPAAPTRQAPRNWEELVERAKGESIALWTALMNVGLLEWSETRIHLECPRNGRSWDDIGSEAGRRKLERLFGEWLGRAVQVEVSAAASQEAPKAASLSGKRDAERRARMSESIKRGEQDPSVLLVREVFGGGEVSVKPLAPVAAQDESPSDDRREECEAT